MPDECAGSPYPRRYSVIDPGPICSRWALGSSSTAGQRTLRCRQTADGSVTSPRPVPHGLSCDLNAVCLLWLPGPGFGFQLSDGLQLLLSTGTFGQQSGAAVVCQLPSSIR